MKDAKQKRNLRNKLFIKAKSIFKKQHRTNIQDQSSHTKGFSKTEKWIGTGTPVLYWQKVFGAKALQFFQNVVKFDAFPST